METRLPSVESAPWSMKWQTRLPLIRLTLAWIMTLGLLLYAWERTLVLWMLQGEVEIKLACLVLFAVLTIMALTWGLSKHFTTPRNRLLIGIGVPLSWIVTNGGLIGFYAGPTLPLPYVLLSFVPMTLWVPWLAWITYGPFTWWRPGILVLLLAAFVSLGSLLRIGLTGDTHLDFAWRWSGPKSDTETEIGDMLPVAPIDLTQTTDHDYAEYLGSKRQAVIDNVRLAPDWNKAPPKLLWRKAVEAGWGAFAVVGDYAITQEQHGQKECVICYRVSDGALIWRHADSANFQSSLGGPGPRGTPTIRNGRVYTIGATGLLNCLNGGTGQSIWSVDILKDNQAGNISHGVCGSPLIVDEKVVVSPTGNNGISLAAYDKDTGKRIWQGGKDRASYSSPMLADLLGMRQILLFTEQGITGNDSATGQVLWSFPWRNGEGVNCAQPIPNAGGSGQVFISTAYGKGCALLRLDQPSPGGPWSVQSLWQNNHMKTKFTTPVEYNGCIYGLDDGILECIDLKDGKRLWKAGRYQHGQILLVRNLILVQTETGEVILVQTDRVGLHELGRIPALTGKTWNNPALAGRHLLVRNDHEAACYELPLEK